MGMTDHPGWGAYKAALERLARAGVRMEAARSMNAPDLEEAEEAFRVAMEAYDAAREQLADLTQSQFDGVPVLRAWLSPTELAFRRAAPPSKEQEAGQE